MKLVLWQPGSVKHQSLNEMLISYELRIEILLPTQKELLPIKKPLIKSAMSILTLALLLSVTVPATAQESEVAIEVGSWVFIERPIATLPSLKKDNICSARLKFSFQATAR